ncbi:MAG: hypothetical protein ACR2FJ_01445 [Qipengyuania sp.]
MMIGQIACVFGRHRIDHGAIKRVHGQHVGRCRHCRTPLEQSTLDQWEVQLVRDAGLGYHRLR